MGAGRWPAILCRCSRPRYPLWVRITSEPKHLLMDGEPAEFPNKQRQTHVAARFFFFFNCLHLIGVRHNASSTYTTDPKPRFVLPTTADISSTRTNISSSFAQALRDCISERVLQRALQFPSHNSTTFCSSSKLSYPPRFSYLAFVPCTLSPQHHVILLRDASDTRDTRDHKRQVQLKRRHNVTTRSQSLVYLPASGSLSSSSFALILSLQTASENVGHLRLHPPFTCLQLRRSLVIARK